MASDRSENLRQYIPGSSGIPRRESRQDDAGDGEADDADDAEPLPACHDRIGANAYRKPREHEREVYAPCKFCFPDDEITVDADDLLVTTCSSSAQESLHRHEDTGDIEWAPSHSADRTLHTALYDDDVTSIEDLAAALDGGDAGGD